MPVFFQKIPESRFDANASFVVKESRGMRLFIGLFLLLFAVVAFKAYLLVSIFFAVASALTLVRSRRTQVIMTVNRNGFFYYGKLVTDWDNFVSARFVDELPVFTSSSAGLSDKFFLVIRYYKDNRPECFERKIALTNSQDKSEEEIFAAIGFYHKQSRDGH